MTVRLGVLLSGGGRTLVNLADRIADGALDATIAVVIASRGSAAGIERARERGLPVEVEAGPDDERRHDAVARHLDAHGVDLVCLAGYLRWFRVDQPRRDRVLNIHPALLPDFGGPGMHGLHVHRAVLAAGRSFSGCTVHFVDEHYDHGPILLQRACPVEPGDDAERLAERVFAEECRAYPEAIELVASGRARVEAGRAVIRADGGTADRAAGGAAPRTIPG